MGCFVFSAVYSRRNTSVKTLNIKFHRIFVEWEWNCPMQSEERDRDIRRLTVTFRNFLKGPKKRVVWWKKGWRGIRWGRIFSVDTWSCGLCKKWIVMFWGLVLCLFIAKQIQKAPLICDVSGCHRTEVEAFVLLECYKVLVINLKGSCSPGTASVYVGLIGYPEMP